MKPSSHRRLNLVLAVLALAVFLVLGAVLLFDREPPEPAPATCGRPADTYQDGTPLGSDTAKDVAGVHAAACAGDYDALLPFISESPPQLPGSITPADVVEGWRREDPGGVKLRAVAVVLERPGVGGQGGVSFCDPDRGMVGFSRGTIDMEPGLGGFEFPRGGAKVDCARYAR
jgi:hypothetical protein